MYNIYYVLAFCPRHIIKDFWIGLYKNTPSNQPKKSGWYWQNGRPYNTRLDLWADSEPSGRRNENCGRITASENNWRDTDCQAQYNFICKYFGR